MKKLALLFTALVLGTVSTMATTIDTDIKVAERDMFTYSNSFIFVEDGITFSVYPDGEFDFYIDNRIGRTNQNVTFNTGFDYSPFAQYDDYGAVIQVENIPIYYDYNGRVNQIGNVNINYRNGRLNRLGNMTVYYNNRGFYDYHRGYINNYNRYYVYRPFHALFSRPILSLCLVNSRPYRRYYNPVRYTYYRPYNQNRRWSYAKIGREYRGNNARRETSKIYRNDRRVATHSARSTRSNRNTTIRKSPAVTNRRTVASNTRTNRSVRPTVTNRTSRSTTTRSSNTNRRANAPRATQTNKPRVTQNNTRTQRSTVNRSTQTRAPRAVQNSPRVTSRSTSSKSTTARSSGNRNTSSRATTSRSSSNRSSASKSASNRSSSSRRTIR